MKSKTENAAFIAARKDAEGWTAQLKAFPLPPDDFDPLKATDATLKYYGLHRRPDPQKHPLLAQRWDEIYSRKLTFIL